MLQVVMSLEERVAGVEFDEDTPDAPDVAREAPPEIQYDLRGAVVSRGDDRRVVFVVKGRRPEVDEPDLAVEKYSPLSRIPRYRMRRGRDIPIVREGLIRVAHEQDVFRF